MIYYVRSLPAGTSVQVWLTPPSGTRRTRVLRRGSDAFSSWDDPGAAVVLDTADERVVVDAQGLANGQLVYYKPYYWNGTAWTTAPTVSATPGLTFSDLGIDPLLFVRQRLDDGLRGLVVANRLRHPKGHIQVLAALPALDDVTLPVVTVALVRETPLDRVLGDRPSPGHLDLDDFEWHDADGWLARVQLHVTAFTFNVEERIYLRRAIRNVIIANLDVFENHGLHEVEFSQEDMDDVQNYNAPMFLSVGTFSCVTAAATGREEAAIRTVESELTAIPTTLAPISARAG